MKDLKDTISHLQIIHIWAKFTLEEDTEFFTTAHYKKLLEWSMDAIKEIKQLQEENNRYAHLLQSDAEDIYVRYIIKKRKHFLMQYQNQRANWTNSPEIAWMTLNKEMAENFAKLTGGKVVEINLIERKLPREGGAKG